MEMKKIRNAIQNINIKKNIVKFKFYLFDLVL